MRLSHFNYRKAQITRRHAAGFGVRRDGVSVHRWGVTIHDHLGVDVPSPTRRSDTRDASVATTITIGIDYMHNQNATCTQTFKIGNAS